MFHLTFNNLINLVHLQSLLVFPLLPQAKLRDLETKYKAKLMDLEILRDGVYGIALVLNHRVNFM